MSDTQLHRLPSGRRALSATVERVLSILVAAALVYGYFFAQFPALRWLSWPEEWPEFPSFPSIVANLVSPEPILLLEGAAFFAINAYVCVFTLVFPRRIHFETRTMMAVVTLLCVEFAIISYVGTLVALAIPALSVPLVVLASIVLVPRASRCGMQGRDVSVYIVWTAILFCAVAYAAVGSHFIYHQIEQARIRSAVANDLGCTFAVENCWREEGQVDVVILDSLDPAGLLAQAGCGEGDAILSDDPPSIFLQHLRNSRVTEVTLTFARGDRSVMTKPLEEYDTFTAKFRLD